MTYTRNHTAAYLMNTRRRRYRLAAGDSAEPTLLEIMNQYAADGLFVSWLHLGDVTALKPDAAGGTFAHGNTLGLAIGREQMGDFETFALYLDAQDELCADYTFELDDASWFEGVPQWNIVAGQMVGTSVGAFEGFSQNIDTSDDPFCFTQINVASISSGQLQPYLGNSGSGVASLGTIATPVVNTRYQYHPVGENDTILCRAGATGFSGAVNSVSVKKIECFPWQQATAANRPLYNRVSDGNGGFNTYLTYDGINDALINTTAMAALDNACVAALVRKVQGEDRFCLLSGAPSKYLFLARDGDASSAIANSTGSPSIYVDGVEVTTRGALYAAIDDGEWHFLVAREADFTGWTEIRIGGTNVSSYEMHADHPDMFFLDEDDVTDEILTNIEAFQREQVGAS